MTRIVGDWGMADKEKKAQATLSHHHYRTIPTTRRELRLKRHGMSTRVADIHSLLVKAETDSTLRGSSSTTSVFAMFHPHSRRRHYRGRNVEDHSQSSDEKEMEEEQPQQKEEEKQPVAEPEKAIKEECDLNVEM